MTSSTSVADSSEGLADPGIMELPSDDSGTMLARMAVVIDLTNSDVQRTVTLGKMSWEEFCTNNRKKRLELYRSIYSDQEECMVASLEMYRVEEPWTKRLRTLTYDGGFMDDDFINMEYNTSNSNGSMCGSSNHYDSSHPTEGPTERVTRHQQNHTDIYGRIPPKEPKTLARCSICDREIAVTRFAPHLDKCMNLGTNRSATTTTNTTTGTSGNNNNSNKNTSSSSSNKQ